MLVVPAAWVAGPRKVDHWRTLVRARAIENTVYVVAAASPAPRYTGHSMVVDPLGDVLAEAGEGAAVLTAVARPRASSSEARTDQPLAGQPASVTFTARVHRPPPRRSCRAQPSRSSAAAATGPPALRSCGSSPVALWCSSVVLAGLGRDRAWRLAGLTAEPCPTSAVSRGGCGRDRRDGVLLGAGGAHRRPPVVFGRLALALGLPPCSRRPRPAPHRRRGPDLRRCPRCSP